MHKAVLACKEPVIIGHPSERDLKYLVISNLEDYPVTIPDMDNARKIFSTILGGVRGKTTRQNPYHVTTDYVAIPKDFLALHKYVTLVANIILVNNVPF